MPSKRSDRRCLRVATASYGRHKEFELVNSEATRRGFTCEAIVAYDAEGSYGKETLPSPRDYAPRRY